MMFEQIENQNGTDQSEGQNSMLHEKIDSLQQK